MDKMKKILLGIAAFLAILAGGAGANEMLGGRGNYQERIVLNAVSATSTGSAHNVADFVHIGLTVVTQNGASSTLKVGCSMMEVAPNFASSSNSTNLCTTNSIASALSLSLCFAFTTFKTLFVSSSNVTKACTI